ncbi:hypothetical protein [Paenibacillus hamazuiensis]|uniref:hypothetical protein n=1 Tax=Paenibacillus hamazuiensis TaxID=2936508 RepID=UPI00200F6BB3|nr:hypothetical protein [Paenibacillus hamazuiensis]
MKKIILIASLGLCVGVAGAYSGYFINISKANNSSVPNFVNSKETINEIPIVKNKILKANANYKNLHGTVLRTQNGKKSKTEVWISQPNNFKVIYTPNINVPNEIITSVNDGQDVQTKEKDNTIKKSKPMKEMKPKNKLENENAIVPDYNGTFLPIGNINELIHPELLVQSVFRSGDISISDKLSYLDRSVTQIKVDLKGSKLGTTQEFLVDNETGVVLKSTLYDKKEVIDTLEFISIEFPSKFETNSFELLEK